MVEYGQSCYRSKWYLFTGPGLETVEVEGRYYFAKPGTRHAPLHNLGSRRWNDKNWEIEQALGESVSAEQQFDHGELPPLIPNDTIVGSRRCISHGDNNSVAWDDTIAGFIPDCFNTKEKENIWFKVSEFPTCVVQRNFMYIIKKLYENNPTDIVNLVADWLGPTVDVSVHFGNTIFPSYAILKDQDWFVMVCNGTTTFQQFALQAFGSLLGPINFGIYSTLPLWYQCSTYLYEKALEGGLDENHRVFLCGHSYGGAAMLNLVARLKNWIPDREVRYMTFGAPKIGDTRLVSLVERASGISILNDNDIVGVLPPDLSLTAAVYGNFTLALLSLFNLWQPAPQRVILQPSGFLRPETPYVVAQNVLNDLIQDAIDGDPFPTFASHNISEYLERTRLRCPGLAPDVPACHLLFSVNYELQVLIESADIPEIDGLTGVANPASTGGTMILVSSPTLVVILFNACFTPTGGGTQKPGTDWYIELNTGPNAGIYATEVRDMGLEEIEPNVIYTQTIELTDIGGSPTGKYATLTFTFVPIP